jgi:hypothetical protein
MRLVALSWAIDAVFVVQLYNSVSAVHELGRVCRASTCQAFWGSTLGQTICNAEPANGDLWSKHFENQVRDGSCTILNSL